MMLPFGKLAGASKFSLPLRICVILTLMMRYFSKAALNQGAIQDSFLLHLEFDVSVVCRGSNTKFEACISLIYMYLYMYVPTDSAGA